MYNYLKQAKKTRHKRALRVRKHVRGTLQKPRLSVHKSNKNLFAQLIDDESGVTLTSFGTMAKENKGATTAKKSKESAQLIGKKIAEEAKKQKIDTVVFDRGRYKYHGLLSEVANAAREAGLKF